MPDYAFWYFPMYVKNVKTLAHICDHAQQF